MDNNEGVNANDSSNSDESIAETKATHLPGSALTSRSLHVEFTGLRGSLFKILLKNTLLSFVTLGIYRFWAKTWLRRYFWQSIRLGNEPLEYSGRPMELFIGMLVAMAVLVPLGLAYSALTTVMSGSSGIVQGILEISYYSIILALIHFAVFRIWRYRLSRTIWRGIHFHLTGQAWRYSIYAMLWTLAAILTLGMAYPWMRIALFRYRVERMHFGDRVFSFTASAKALIVPWLVRFLVPIGFLGTGFLVLYDDMIAVINLIVEAGNTGNAETTELGGNLANAFPPSFGLFFGLAIVSGSVLGVWYRVREARVVASGLGFGSMQFMSAILFRRICLIWLKVTSTFLVLFLILAAVNGFLVFGFQHIPGPITIFVKAFLF